MARALRVRVSRPSLDSRYIGASHTNEVRVRGSEIANEAAQSFDPRQQPPAVACTSALLRDQVGHHPQCLVSGHRRQVSHDRSPAPHQRPPRGLGVPTPGPSARWAFPPPVPSASRCWSRARSPSGGGHRGPRARRGRGPGRGARDRGRATRSSPSKATDELPRAPRVPDSLEGLLTFQP